MKKSVFHILILLFVINYTYAQDPKTIKLTEKDGLPDVEFYDIVQDDNNLIWLAADKGLYAFDGKEYTNYTNKDKKGLSVFGLKFDDNKQLWCNNISGQFFYVKNNALVLFLDLKNELKGELSEFIFLDNKLYVFSTSVILSIDLKTKERTNIILPSTSKKNITRSPYKVDEKIYFTCNDEIFTISKSNTLKKLNIKTKISGNNVFPKFFKYHKKLYLLLYDNKSNKNYFYEKKDNHFALILLPEVLQNNRIITISENNNDLWLCTSNGLVILATKDNEFVLKDFIFKNDFITKCIVDKNQTIWISTLNNGIYIIPSLDIKSYENIVSNEVISAIEKIATTSIIIGTTKGNLYQLDLKTGKRKKIEINNSRKIAALLYISRENKLLISTEETVYSYHLKSKTITAIESLSNAKDLQQIGNSNQIVYSGFDRATVFELKNDNLIKVKNLNFSRSYSSFSDNENHKIYVCYVDNLVVYDNSYTATILKYNNSSITAKDICMTKDNTVWIATFNDGILGYKNNKFSKKLNLSNGLISKVIQKIKADDTNLLIVSDKGIQVFDSKNSHFISSLTSNTITPGNIKDIIINEESVLFISQEHILEINKKAKSKHYNLKKINIKSIQINEKETLIKSNYSLPYDKNRIKITFHINGYYPDNELSFEYRLKGLNEEWVLLDKNVNFVNFNSLPPRDYSFELRAKSRNETGYIFNKINFQINQPYWKKWWFVIGLFAVGFFLITLFYKNKLTLKEKEKELALKNAKYENELALLKLENLKSQMNPHFIFNALNSIQEYIILNQRNLASSYLAKFADLIRAYLEHSSKGYITLNEEIECLDIYLQLEKLRFEEKFNYKISALENIEEIKIPTMLIQPYVENAIKHGLLHKKENRDIAILFDLLKVENTLKCTIVDNGIGRKKAAQLNKNKHQSFATRATQNRLELLNFGKVRKIGVTIDDLTNDENEPIGTKVTLLIPIIN